MRVTENANTMGMQRHKMIKMPVDTHFVVQFANMVITIDLIIINLLLLSLW